MPALSPTMKKGKILQWNKKEGDQVSAGDVLAEVETDKAAVGLELQEDGYLAKILVPAGDRQINLGEIIAIVVDSKESIGAFKDFKAEGGEEGGAPKEAPKEKEQEKKEQPKEAAPKKEEKPEKGKEGGAKQDQAQQQQDSGSRIFASPLARKVAKEGGISLDGIKGSGENGRILEHDVEAAIAKAKSGKPVEGKKGAAAPPIKEYEDIPLTNVRAVRLLFPITWGCHNG